MLTGKQLYLHMKPQRLSVTVHKLKKKVSFDNKVYVREIYSRKYLFDEDLVNELWYTEEEYKSFISGKIQNVPF